MYTAMVIAWSKPKLFEGRHRYLRVYRRIINYF